MTQFAAAGSFKYLAPSVASSLVRNGRVLTRRDRDGNDSGTTGVVIDAVDRSVGDARRVTGAQRRTLDRNGFELLESPIDVRDIDFFRQQSIVEAYYPECEELVRKATGADRVHAFDHNVRSAAHKAKQRHLVGGQAVQAPIKLVHGDYTLASGPQRLRDLAHKPSENDTYAAALAEGETLLSPDLVENVLENGRFVLLNVWRNIAPAPVLRDPLALCDAATVSPTDLVVFEIHYHDRVGENYFAKHAEAHRWFAYPEMTRDEALLIKQWDSQGRLARSGGAVADASDPEAPCTFSFHSAFRDPATPEGAPERSSIEVRCVALFH